MTAARFYPTGEARKIKMAKIRRIIKENPDMTVKALCDRFSVSRTTVSNLRKEMRR